METVKNSGTFRAVIMTLGLLFALVILPSNAKAYAILIFGAAVFAHLLSRKWHFDWKFFLTNGLLFLLVGITVLYSDNMDYAFKKLQSMASLLVFPFIFALFTKEEGKRIFRNITTYLWIYVIAVFLINVVPFIYFYATEYSWSEMVIHYATVVRVKMGKFNVHPIYLSMHCSAAILFSFYIFRKLKSKWAIVLLLLMDITFLTFLLYYAKKGPIIALIVVFSLFILFQYKKGYLRLYLLIVGALILLTLAIPKTRDRFVELVKIENLSEGEVTSTNIRYTIYITAMEMVKRSPIGGYGIGDYNYVLQDQFKADGQKFLYEEHYNAHNQYLSMLLIGGIPLLLMFVIMFGLNMIYAIRFNNQLLILLIFFYSIVMFTENILEREDGVIFFSFFLNFFALRSLYASEDSEE